MPRHNKHRLTRRQAVLTGLSGLIGTTVLPQSVLADDGESIQYTPVYFGIYLVSGTQPINLNQKPVPYPDTPLLSDIDDEADNGADNLIDFDMPVGNKGDKDLLFDSREIKREDDDRLRHILKFRQDEDIIGEAREYTLVENDDVYKSSGTTIDFTLSGPKTPLVFLTKPGDYRAVFRNGIKLYDDDEREGQFKWAYTRVDFYNQANQDEPVISAVYVIWDDELDKDGDTSTVLPIPNQSLEEAGWRVIDAGPLPYSGKTRDEDEEEEDDEKEDEDTDEDDEEEDEEDDEKDDEED